MTALKSLGADSRIRHKRATEIADPMDQKDAYAYVAQLKKTRLKWIYTVSPYASGQDDGAML